jgi:hypothetical protein
MLYHNQVTIEKSSWIENLVDHRLIASLLPLIALSNYEPTLKTTITNTAKAVQRAKIEEKACSMDGSIINVLYEKISDGLFDEWQPNKHYLLEEAKIKDENKTEKLKIKPLTTKD